jgi:hypothetical protein
MPNAPEYSIARDYDPSQEILSAESDPMAAYLTYLADFTGGAVGNIGFTVDDFREYRDFRNKSSARACSKPRAARSNHAAECSFLATSRIETYSAKRQKVGSVTIAFVNQHDS